MKKTTLTLVAIFLVGALLRLCRYEELFMYNHDHDLASWMVKDVVVNKHFRLVGQETSTSGVFIGPLYYYLLIPFYVVFNMDPLGGVFLSAILGLFGIASVYFVFSRIFDKNVGLIGAFIYAVSFYTVSNDREVVPTMSVITWTVWYFYGLHLLLQGKQLLGFIVLGLLSALIWHLNFALAILTPLVVLSLVLAKRKIEFKSLILGALMFLIISLPFFVFEIRHNFGQTKAIFSSLATNQKDVISGFLKLDRVVLLASKNTSSLLWGSLPGVTYALSSALFITTLAYLWVKKILKKEYVILLVSWVLIYIAFFASYSKIVSEYYLNGVLLPVILVLSVGVAKLLQTTHSKSLGIMLLFIFALFNIYRFVSQPVNRSGYRERKAVVSHIKADAKERGYPCIAISYITDPGYELGYRYFFFLEDMHVNRPNSMSPVYTVVFPLKPVFEVHKTFGAIGLIYPNYSQYNETDVAQSCSGQNSNLTDPMFGYVE